MHDIVDETLHEIVDPLVYAEAADLIEEHRAAGREIVIVSSSGAEMVEPIGEMLGADRVVATRMVIADGPVHRRDRLLRLRREQGGRHASRSPPRAATTWPTATPTATRSPTCRCSARSGHPTAVNPDRALRRRRSSTAGRCASSPGRSACAPGSPFRRAGRHRGRDGRGGRRRGTGLVRPAPRRCATPRPWPTSAVPCRRAGGAAAPEAASPRTPPVRRRSRTSATWGRRPGGSRSARALPARSCPA